MNPIVSLEDVSLRYHSIGGETSAVSHLSLSVQAGEFISIVGPSGCGKSTILSMLAGQLAPSEGSIYIGGTIGYMLQKDYLLQWRSIRSNALLGLEIQKKLTPENIAYVDTLLTQYGLGDFKNSLPNQLSGGMRQRAALIRTLAVVPIFSFWMSRFPHWIIRQGFPFRMKSARLSAKKEKPPSSSRMIFPKPSVFPTAWWCSPSVLQA